jgi:hypothetical protein
MGRFRATEIEHYGGQGGTGYFSLKDDKDTAQVRFMYDRIDDIEGYSVHKVSVDGKDRYVNCLREYNDPVDVCPFCKNRMYVTAKLFVPIYNEDTRRVQIWERGKKFYGKLSSILSRTVKNNNSVASYLFEIERNGKKGDTSTTYEIYVAGGPDDTNLDNLPAVPDVIGSLVLDKSADDMDYYLHNGVFPENNAPVSRRSARTESEEESVVRRGSRRTPMNREDVY